MERKVPVTADNPSIIRIEDKCVNCGLCKNICKDYIGINNSETNPICINCGQCSNVCPTDSIVEKIEYESLKRLIGREDKIIIFNTSPSVRISLGEEFGLEYGSFVEGKMVSLLRKLGANYVLDTNFSADLTIMEEASELVSRITNKNAPLPQFTSCCPAWVKFAEIYHSNILKHLSSAKSPIGMQGATVKTYFCEKMGIDPKKVINVAVTPCTAKKFEIRREEMCDASKYHGIENMRDMDYVITTRELSNWAKEEGIIFDNLENSAFDKFMGEASGAGVIFGNSGGVMEAALRTAHKLITNEDASEEFYNLTPVRGMNEFKEATIKIGEYEVTVAVIYGTKTLRDNMDLLINSGKYHFVEVMTCPGGCIGGGGQPKNRKNKEVNEKRIDGLYKRDMSLTNKLSYKNKEINRLYEEFYVEPLSEKAETMLHTSYIDRSKEYDLEENVEEVNKVSKYRCTVCNYVHEGELTEDLVCPICHLGSDVFEEIEEEK